MMMNIRGLIFDDPNHTVYLQSLVFASAQGEASAEDIEMEEVV